MSAVRALLRAARRRRSGSAVDAPPVFWGRVGEYEAVCRRGMLFLLSPEGAHPSLRVAEPRPKEPAVQLPRATPGRRLVS